MNLERLKEYCKKRNFTILDIGPSVCTIDGSIDGKKIFYVFNKTNTGFNGLNPIYRVYGFWGIQQLINDKHCYLDVDYDFEKLFSKWSGILDELIYNKYQKVKYGKKS